MLSSSWEISVPLQFHSLCNCPRIPIEQLDVDLILLLILYLEDQMVLMKLKNHRDFQNFLEKNQPIGQV